MVKVRVEVMMMVWNGDGEVGLMVMVMRMVWNGDGEGEIDENSVEW